MFTVDHVYKFCFHQGSYHYELMMRVVQFKVLSHTVSKFLFNHNCNCLDLHTFDSRIINIVLPSFESELPQLFIT